MRTLILITTVFVACILRVNGQSDIYKVEIDLQKVKKDRVKVIVQLPEAEGKEIIYTIPAVIPGTYAQEDFGRFIEKVKAYNRDGKKIKVQRKGKNDIIISNSNGVSKIEYWVNDTWDGENVKHYIFQPGGTNIEEGKNFVLNHHGFIGYIVGKKMLPYEVTVIKPEGFYGAGSLKKQEETADKDVLYADDYVYLVDNPMMYSIPDTVSYMLGDARISIAVHSTNGVVKAKDIYTTLQPLSQALKNFFGDMPTDRYTFLYYFMGDEQKDISGDGAFGALEHSYSSFYFIPEIADESFMASIIQDIAAHEFLHILTPLNIHSEEIAYFDFRNPEMSKHLWMYEGVTEYFSLLVQLRDSLISEEVFLENMQEKIVNAADYPDVSFTEMSEHILTDEYKDMYLNVYEKGALIAFLLDIRLNELSNGEIGLLELMKKLAEKYGPEHPFKDDELIPVIVELTYPEIGDFFKKYVIGSSPLPYKTYLEKIGWEYKEEDEKTGYYFGRFGLKLDGNDVVFFQVAENLFEVKNNDKLKKINGTSVSIGNIKELIGPILNGDVSGEVVFVVERDGELKELSATPMEVELVAKHVLNITEDPTTKQLDLKKALYYKK